MNPLVAVNILVYNEPLEVIDRLLESLANVDYPRDRWRLVIVNNSCVDHDLAAYLRRRWLCDPRLPQTILEIQTPNLGFAGGHNKTLAIARRFNPEFVYLLNADAHVDPAFLSTMVAAAQQQPNAAIIQSRLMLAQEPELLNSAGNALHFLGFGFSIGYRNRPAVALRALTGRRDDTKYFYASGAAVLIRCAMLDRIGGLYDDSFFMYHEDVDLSWRARLAGYDIGYAPTSVVYHRYEFSKSIKKFYWMERNRHLVNLSLYRLPTLILIAPIAIFLELGTFAFAIRSGWAKEKMRAWAHLLKPSTWRWIRERRRIVNAFRRVPDREILACMCGVVVNQDIENPLLTRVVNPILNAYLRVLRMITFW